MEYLRNDLQHMANSIQGLLGEHEEGTCYLPKRSTSFETEQANHHRTLSGETLLGEPSPSTAFSSPEPTNTKSNDPLFESLGYVNSPEPSKIPFQIRHRFFGWLIPVLEGCYTEYATAKLGTPYLDGVLSDKCLDDVAQIDLPTWRHIIEHAVQKGVLTTQDFYAYKLNRSNILNGAEAIRHAWIHREDIVMVDLLDAKCLPALLGDLGRKAEIQHAFDLVLAVTANTDDDDPVIMDSIDNLFTTREGTTTQTDVFANFQKLIERRLYHYAQQHHPDILKHQSWTSPEQGEMPRWEEAFRDTPFVFQTDFANDTGDLLSSCLRNARRLRNDVAHRHRYGQEGFLDHVHNSIKTLLVLDDHSGAINIEIAAEAWIRGTTRDEVLLRLRDEYLVDDVDGIVDSLEKRREVKRRAAIAEILRGEMLLDGRPCSNTLDDKCIWNKSSCPTSCAEEDSPELSIPEQIRLTPPDTWATRRETFSNSMHPVLKVLTIPEWSTLWDYWQAKAELEWEEPMLELEGCSEDIDDADKKAGQHSPEVGEELADLDCDTTVLDDVDGRVDGNEGEWADLECDDNTVLDDDEGDEEEGEWYDSDDTAFDYEDDDTSKFDPLPEFPLKIEPEGVWSPSEAIAGVEPWLKILFGTLARGNEFRACSRFKAS